jgi:hypothetical protein
MQNLSRLGWGFATLLLRQSQLAVKQPLAGFSSTGNGHIRASFRREG